MLEDHVMSQVFGVESHVDDVSSQKRSLGWQQLKRQRSLFLLTFARLF